MFLLVIDTEFTKNKEVYLLGYAYVHLSKLGEVKILELKEFNLEVSDSADYYCMKSKEYKKIEKRAYDQLLFPKEVDYIIMHDSLQDLKALKKSNIDLPKSKSILCTKVMVDNINDFPFIERKNSLLSSRLGWFLEDFILKNKKDGIELELFPFLNKSIKLETHSPIYDALLTLGIFISCNKRYNITKKEQ